jgi:hypothetical protein
MDSRRERLGGPRERRGPEQHQPGQDRDGGASRNRRADDAKQVGRTEDRAKLAQDPVTTQTFMRGTRSMAHLDIDFVIPMALLFASIVGVMLVRVAAARGERAAKERARRAIAALGLEPASAVEPGEAGMPEGGSASSD